MILNKKKMTVIIFLFFLIIYQSSYAVTFMVKDIRPGFASTTFKQLTEVNGTLFFLAGNGDESSYQLWKSDGTASGTVMVKDINPSGDDRIDFLTEVNDTLFFVANDGVHGEELWKSDGTSMGTVMVKDINIGGSSFASDLLSCNGFLYFHAYDDRDALWKSDGTAVGTVLVSINHPLGRSDPRLNMNHNSLYMNYACHLVLNDGRHGYELWRTFGTETSTYMLKDINQDSGDTEQQSSYPEQLTQAGNYFFFTANGGVNSGRELWMSNGTGTGTVLVEDIWPHTVASEPQYLTAFRPRMLPWKVGVVFSADDGLNGRELWHASFGFGAAMIKDINYTTGMPLSSDPKYLTVVDNMLFFAATAPGTERELWQSDGTEAGTVILKDINPSGSSSPSHLVNANGTLYFSADGGDVFMRELWKSDGTAEGTVRVKNINTFGSSNPKNFIYINGTLYFTADDGIHGRELWKTTELTYRSSFPWSMFHPAMKKGNNH